MSTLSVDTIQGKTTAGTVAMPAGMIVQTVEFTEQTNYTTTSTNTDVQGPQTGTFTLKNTSNKVLVTATFLGNTTLSTNYNGGRFSLYRGAISGGTRITQGTEPQILTYSTDMWTWVCLQKLDIPGANTTYSIGFNKHSNAGQANIRGAYGATVILMQEIQV